MKLHDDLHIILKLWVVSWQYTCTVELRF